MRVSRRMMIGSGLFALGLGCLGFAAGCGGDKSDGQAAPVENAQQKIEQINQDYSQRYSGKMKKGG